MEPYGLDAIVEIERLPYLKVGTFAGGQSSFDRAGGNNDFGQYLATDIPAGDKVILDLSGPGTVYRLWFTGFDPDTANLKIYIDGALFARTYLLAKLFTGAYSELPSPLAGEESAGFYCYVPIPFRSSIRITTNGAAAKPLQLFYYNVGYHRYTRGRNIVSWPESNAAVAAAVGVWNKAELGENPNSGDPTTVRISGSVRLPGMGIPISLQEIEGPRIVYGIRINVDADVSVLNDILLRITWDREPDAAVHAPLSAFFALGHYGANSARSLVVGAIDDWLYTYFPMPFAHHANIELINRLPMPLESVKYEILHKAFNEDFSRVGYFRTAYFRHLAGPGLSMTLLDIEGAGHLVGVAMSFEGSGPHDMEANAPSLLFLEGDERIYVDDCRTPTIYGTGTEDFFNAGWYFTKVPFSKPVHGCTTKNTDKGYGVVSAYRLFLHDAVPFRKHLRATIEHGPANDVPVLARTVAYYYYQPVIRALPWGRLEIGDPGSESQYGYWNSSQHWSGSRTYTFEGDLDKIQISHGGRAHRGTSRFAFPTPADNQGFLLRRMFDQGIRNQRARVRVNGQDLGSWSRTGGNTADNDAGRGKWCEDDLPIPASFTSGKTYLHFDVAYEPSDATLSDPALDWNEFSYSLYDLHETGPAHPSLMSPRLPILCAIDVVSRNLDKLDLVCPDEGGTLVPVAWEPIFGASWYVWRPIAGVSVLPGCPVSLVSRSTDKIDAFFTNSGSQVCTAAWDPKLGWHTWRMTDSVRPGSGELTPAVTLGAAITAVSRSTDHLDVFVVATDGRLMSAAWPDDDPRYAGSGGQWAGWWSLLAAGIKGVPGAVAGATSRSTDKLDVFLTDAKGEVHTAAWEPSLGWRNWKLRDRLSAGSQVPNLPPGAPITVVSRSADHLDIFVLDKHGSIWSAAWQPGFAFWAGWWALPGIRGAPGSAVRAISRSPDQLDLFATGADGEVHTAAWNPRSPWEGGKLRDRMPEATIPDLAAGCPIAAASRRTDYLDIFVVAKDRRIWTAAWEPSRNWLGWRPIGY